MATRTTRSAAERAQVGSPAKRAPRGKVVPHLTAAERVARGKAARKEVPRASHAGFAPAAARHDPVELLESQSATRVAELVPIRYGRMLVSAFTFYRGAAMLMANDLAGTPRSGINVQVCGDAHLLNFGVFASPERRMVFSINDFDETFPGPWEWDVKRLAASFAIGGRDNGFSAKQRQRVLLDMVGAYRVAMGQFAAMTNLGVWYATADADTLMRKLAKEATADVRKRAEANLAKARTKDSMQALGKLTHVVDGELRIISAPPLIQPIEEIFQGMALEQISEWLRAELRKYRQTLQSDRRHLLEEFQLVQVARKVVGVGSVGTRAWIALMFGRDQSDPLFLQVKEAQASVLQGLVGASPYRSNGQRVVHGQHLMQAESDIFLGWTTTTGVDGVSRDYYFRQLHDWKGSAMVETMTPAAMSEYARVCAWTLARAHARSGDRIAMASYLGSSDVFDRAIAEFSEAYADQNERDYDALVQAEKDGRITAQSGI